MSKVKTQLLKSAQSVLAFYKRYKNYSLAVIGTTLVVAFYYTFIASDRYVSEARVIVERQGAAQALSLGIASLLPGTASQSELDAQLIKRFIESPAMLDYLQETLDLRSHYSNGDIDLLSRMGSDVAHEDFIKYYLKHIKIDIDKDSMTLSVTAQGFDPEYAQNVARAIVQRSEQFVNGISQTLAKEQITFVQGELDATYLRLQKASLALIDMQNKNKLFSPEVENQSLSQIIAGLQQELSTQRTELKALQSYQSESAPEVVGVKKKIMAIERQIAQERSKQVGDVKDESMNELLLKFKELQLNEQMTADMYKSGLATLEAARLDASRKAKHLVLVSAPTLPDKSVEPRRRYITISFFIIANIIYVIGGLLVATIKDHRE